MQDRDKPMVDMLTLRRDLYFVMSLLLADKEVAKIENVVDWAWALYENEVRRLMLWVAVAMRSLLNLSKESNIQNNIQNKSCGEYWPDFLNQEESRLLTIRQACNSIIHAKTILTYKIPKKIPKKELKRTKTRVYDGRITIRGTYGRKKTHAELDIIEFVRIAVALIDLFEKEEGSHADK